MSDILPETQHFGFTQIGPGEGLAKNGYAFGVHDRQGIDNLIQALFNHRHTGEPALGDPTDAPTLNAVSSGGHLPAATTFYFRASYLDQWGLESAASPEASITTPNPIAAPAAPAATVETASGTLGVGIFSYLLTVKDAYGGETTPSSVNNVQISSGGTNRIRFDLPELPPDGVSFSLYRARPGQSQFYLHSSSTGTVMYDSGEAEDQTVLAPTVNTTNAANSIEVTVPGGFIPLGCVAWRFYRSTTSGGYDGTSLVHEVVEGFTDTSTIPRTMWSDTGDSLLQGFPRNSSSTAPQGSLLSLNDVAGALPLAAIPRGVRCLSITGVGNLSNAEVLLITETPAPIKPVRFTAYLKTPPAPGSSLTLVIQDSAATPATIELVCDDSGGSPAGYFHAEWPVTEAYLVYATGGSVSDPTSVQIITDPLSPTGQSVLLQAEGDWVQCGLGVLDAGTYTVFGSMRANSNPATPPTNDIQFDVIRLDTNAVIATTVDTVSNTIGFSDAAGGSFAAPGGVGIALRISKVTAAVQSYEVASMRYATSVPQLAAGMITVTALITGSPSTPPADVSAVLWF